MQTKNNNRQSDTAFFKLARRAPNLTGYGIIGLISFSLLALLVFVGIMIRRGCLVALLGLSLLACLPRARACGAAPSGHSMEAGVPADTARAQQ